MSPVAWFVLGAILYLLVGIPVSRKIEMFWGLAWPDSFQEYYHRLGLFLAWPFPLTVGLAFAAFWRFTHRTATVRLGTD